MEYHAKRYGILQSRKHNVLGDSKSQIDDTNTPQVLADRRGRVIALVHQTNVCLPSATDVVASVPHDQARMTQAGTMRKALAGYGTR